MEFHLRVRESKVWENWKVKRKETLNAGNFSSVKRKNVQHLNQTITNAGCTQEPTADKKFKGNF